MPNYSSATVVGHVVFDPEVKENTNGTSWLRNKIAVNSYYKKDDERVEETAFIPFKMFGLTATRFADWIKKGDPVLISGEIKQNDWTNEDGDKRSELYITAFKFINLRKRETKPEVGGEEVVGDGSVPF